MTVFSERTNTTILSQNTDADGDPLSVIKINGQANLIGVPIALSVGGSVTITSDGTVTFDDTGFDVPEIGEHVSDGLIATITDGTTEVETTVNLELYGTLQEGSASFGALTLSFHGGIAAPDGATSITGGDPDGYFVVSNGTIMTTLAAENMLKGSYLLVFDNGTNKMITILPDTFSVSGDDELKELLNDNTLPYDGKVISLRPGYYTDHEVPTRTYTSGLTLQGDPDSAPAYIRSIRINKLFGSPDIIVRDLSFASDVIETEYRHRLIYDINTTPNGTLTIQNCSFEGANGSDPKGDGLFPKIDYSGATAIPAVGEGITGSGGAATFIREVHDNADGSGTLYVSDNPGKTSGGSTEGDLWASGQTITAPTWTATTTSGLYGGLPYVGNGIEGQLSFEEMTVENCLFDGLNQAMEVNATRRIIVRGNASKNLLSDFIKVHSGTTAASDLTLIERNLHKEGATSSDDYGNPHRDVIQISGKKLVQHWENFIVRDNMFLTGQGREPGMQALFLAAANQNNFGLYGAEIRNNLVEVGPASAALAFDHAYSSTIENNILITAYQRSEGGSVKARIGYSSGDGLNTARGNVCEAFEIDGIDGGNVTNPKYTDYSTIYPRWTGVLDYASIPELLARFTPVPGSVVMAGSTWSMSTDHGCVNEAGHHIGHDQQDLTQHFIDLNAALDGTAMVSFSVPDTAPAAFEQTGWDLSDSGVGGELTLSVLDLPDDGGSALTDLEVSINSASFTSLGGTQIGDYALTKLTDDMQVSVVLRALNAIGAGPATDAKTATPTTATVTVTVADFAVDDFPFDARASFGENTAQIPLSGTAPAGTVIEARAKELGGSFTTIATADSTGAWAGVLPVPEDGQKYHAEVREVGVASNRSETANRFSTGNIVISFSQSEYDRISNSVHDNIAHPTITDPGALIFLTIDHNAATSTTSPPVQLIRVTDNEPLATAALKYMANAYARHAPGKRFVVCDQMESGTSLGWLVDDESIDVAGRNRHWTVFHEMIQTYLRDTIGTTPSTALYSWWAADLPDYGSTSDTNFEKFEEALAPVFWGETIDGSIFNQGETGPLGYDIDHFFFDNQAAPGVRGRGVFATGELKFSFLWNGFAVEDELQNFETKSNGSVSAGMRNTRLANLGMRQFLKDPRASARGFTQGFQSNHAFLGEDDGVGGWQDYSHPAGETRYGLSLMAEMLAVNHMKVCGQIATDPPTITGATWSRTGAVANVTLAGTDRLTTYRDEDGTIPTLPAQPWRHHVAGFEIERSGSFLQPDSVTITDDGATTGMAQISINYAAENGDVLHYMRGGGYGQLRIEDMQEGYSYNIPGSTIDGVASPLAPLQNLPSGAYLTASGISESPPASAGFNTSTSGPYFYDPLAIGTSVTSLTFALTGTIAASGTTQTLLGLSGSQITFEIMIDGNFRLTLKSSSGTLLRAVNTADMQVSFGTPINVRLAIDLTAGWARLFLDDTEMLNGGNPMWSFAANSGELASVRRLSVLAKNNSSQQTLGTIENINIWLSAEADGSEPANAAYKTIAGELADINSDSWKLGDDAT